MSLSSLEIEDLEKKFILSGKFLKEIIISKYSEIPEIMSVTEILLRLLFDCPSGAMNLFTKHVSANIELRKALLEKDFIYLDTFDNIENMVEDHTLINGSLKTFHNMWLKENDDIYKNLLLKGVGNLIKISMIHHSKCLKNST